jgi:hypothetical protein
MAPLDPRRLLSALAERLGPAGRRLALDAIAGTATAVDLDRLKVTATDRGEL